MDCFERVWLVLIDNGFEKKPFGERRCSTVKTWATRSPIVAPVLMVNDDTYTDETHVDHHILQTNLTIFAMWVDNHTVVLLVC